MSGKEVIIKSLEGEEYKFKIRRLSFKDMKTIRDLRKKLKEEGEEPGYHIVVEGIKLGVVEPKLSEEEIWNLPSFVVMELNDHIMAYTNNTPFEELQKDKEKLLKTLISLPS